VAEHSHLNHFYSDYSDGVCVEGKQNKTSSNKWSDKMADKEKVTKADHHGLVVGRSYNKGNCRACDGNGYVGELVFLLEDTNYSARAVAQLPSKLVGCDSSAQFFLLS